MNDVFERHNVRDVEGNSGTIPPKNAIQKKINRVCAILFKEAADYVMNNGGVAKGKAFEETCTMRSEVAMRKIEKIIKEND
ncbi:MAG: hypothetical protein PHP62_05245 [Candidatus Moranbacteria bacterium]|nr:hypothetical protein [Candidatus Moranbacteria bacterium]